MAPLIGIPSRFIRFPDIGIDCHGVRSSYIQSIVAVGGSPFLIPLVEANPQVMRQYVAACDGFLFVGGEDVDPSHYHESPDPKIGARSHERDALELGLFQEIQRAGKPMLGVCRGLQLINVACGGSLCQDIPSRRPSAICHSNGSSAMAELLHDVDIMEGTRLAHALGSTRRTVNSLHHQCVERLGEGLQVSARATGDDVIEAIESTESGSWILAVQWHPETLWPEPGAGGAGLPWNLNLFRALIEACTG